MDALVKYGQKPSDLFLDEPLKCAIECDTGCASSHQRFEFFRSWHSDIVDVGLRCGDTITFEAQEKIWPLGDCAFAAIDASPHHLLRWEHKRKPAVDHWLVTVKPAAETASTNGKPRRKLRMKNLAAPDVCETEGGIIALFLPHSAVVAPLHPEISDNAGEFLADYLTLLHSNLAHLTQSNVSGVVEATTQMVAATLAPSHEKLEEAQAPIDAVITTRAIRAINCRLADPELTPDHLCRSVGVSRSRLYRIFEPAGGISNYIRRKRLLETRRVLAESTDGRSVSNIAESMGFTDPSTFSRMFKREFGLSPKEARALGWQGVQHSTWLEIDQPVGCPNTLNSLLINNSLGLSIGASS
ncbi:helix-turn-helix domain-containing protein [Pararhizobium sp. O133]|uniref:helix-turn-helix domain-containing protein n=1 Tax=Pararhizobium sp. O133 TaxID=3449278 RepID=UPI003F68626A